LRHQPAKQFAVPIHRPELLSTQASYAEGPRRLTHDPIQEEVKALKGYSDFVNGTLCFFVGVIWAALTSQWMPDKPVDVALILVPFGVLAVAGAFLIARFRSKNLQ
jgi:hypothetical protein